MTQVAGGPRYNPPTTGGGGGGGGSALTVKLDGSNLDTAVTSIDATDALYASAVSHAITMSVYGARAGVLASRPAAARTNKYGFYYATDTKTAYASDGSSWTTLFTLGTISSQDANNVTITGGSVTGITDLAVADGGTGASDAGTARYNLHDQILAAVKAVATSNVSSLSGTTTIDGVSLVAGDYVLLTAQSTGSQNGPWVVAAGAWSRPPDYPAGGTVLARGVMVTNGTAYSGTFWVEPSFSTITVDTTATTWALSNRITAYTLTLLAAASASAARSVLGLGSMAPLNRTGVNIGRLNITGHSWIAGSTVASTGTPYMEMQGMAARLVGMFAIHNDNVMNFAQSGSALTQASNPVGSAYSGWAAALQYLIPSNATMLIDPSASVITHGPCVPGANLIVHGINDISRNSTAWPTQGRNAWKHALRTYLSIARAGAFYKHKYLNSTFTWDSQLTFSGFGTTTTQTTGNSGAAVRATTTNGDYVEFTIPSDFRGGTIAVCFIGSPGAYATQSGATIVGATALTLNATLDYTKFANGDIITWGAGTANAEDVRITAGGGTASLTVTAATKTHANSDPVTHSTGTHRVDWSTSGSNATITGSTQLSGQGYAGARVAVVKRFVCTSADAGKTIRATVAGFAASEATALQFDSVWIEAEYVPPTVVANVPRFGFGIGYLQVNAQAANINADTTTVVAEFDSSVAIADIDALIWGQGGVTKAPISSSNTVVATANALATWNIGVGSAISIAGNRRLVTAITGPVGSDYTITFDGAALTLLTSSLPVSNANWFHTDLIHWNGVGHGAIAGLIYDTFSAISTTGTQLGNTSATWVQDQRASRTGVVNGSYLQPVSCWSSAGAASLNRVHYFPIDIPEECWVTGFAVSTSSAVATAVATVGIYDSDWTMGRPGGLIANLGDVTTATSGVFTASGVCYVRLRPGRYWTALKSVTAAALYRGAGPGAVNQMFCASPSSGASGGISGYVETYGSAGLPASATPTEFTGTTGQVMLQLGAAEFS